MQLTLVPSVALAVPQAPAVQVSVLHSAVVLQTEQAPPPVPQFEVDVPPRHTPPASTQPVQQLPFWQVPLVQGVSSALLVITQVKVEQLAVLHSSVVLQPPQVAPLSPQ